MTRILTYNILFGGTGRIDRVEQIIRSVHPDVVGLLEATRPQVVEALAERLEMEYRLTGHARYAADWQIAVLSRLLSYLMSMEQLPQTNPHEIVAQVNLDFVVPPALRFLNPLLLVIPCNAALSALFDVAGSLYVARGSIRLLRRAGYVDSFRHLNPRARGFTCPAKAPAGRIDYIFASPELAQRLCACQVVTEANGVQGEQASDHLPLLAVFGVSIDNTSDSEIII